MDLRPDAPPAPPTRDDVAAAAGRIAPHVRRTPVIEVEYAALGIDADGVVVCKLDLLQPTGSFKVRGATSLLTASSVPEAGVVAASGGNFALAVAWAGERLGHRVTVFVPSTSPPAKVAGLASLGADVHVVDGFYADALAEADRFVAATGAMRAHAYDQPEVVAGQGTCARELDEQVPALDTVLVAVGGGGLVGGIASWFRGRVRVVGVETAGTAALAAARAAGRPVDVEVGGLAAPSLGARRIGAIGWAAASRWVDDAVTVSDDDVREAQYRLWEACRLVAEPGGATAVAALTSGRVVPAPGERIAAVLCGANAGPAEVLRPA